MDFRPITNKEKYAVLNLSPTSARAKLRKMIIFDLLQQLNQNYCYRCGKLIKVIEELCIEHKTAWMTSENPIENYFNVKNLMFLHLSCNNSRGKTMQNDTEENQVLKTENINLHKKKKISITGYKNVYPHTNPKKPYRVRVKENGKFKSFGVFSTVEEAVIEADKQLLRIYGDNAITNKKMGLIDYS